MERRALGFVVLLLVAAIGVALGIVLRSDHVPLARRELARATAGGERAEPAVTGAPSAERTREVEPAASAAEESPFPTSPADEVPRPVVLHVLDGASGAELRDVEVFVSRTGFITRSRARIDPPESKDLRARGDSPLRLDPIDDGLDLELLVARAPGFELGSLFVHWGSGGEREVRLERGAAIEVVVSGRRSGVAASVWLYDDDRGEKRDAIARLVMSGAPGAPLPPASAWMLARALAGKNRQAELPADGRVLFEPLAAGRWFAVVVARESEEKGFVGVGWVDVVAGETRRLEIPWQPLDPPKGVTASGRVFVPRAWNASERLGLRLKSRDAEDRWLQLAKEPDAGIDDVWSWSNDKLQPGDYEARIDAWRVSLPLRIPPEGADDLDLRVPPPVELAIELVDGETREPVEMHYSQVWLGELTRRTRHDRGWLEYDAQRRRFLARLCVDGGAVPVCAEAGDRLGAARVDLHPGTNEFTLPLWQPARVRLLLALPAHDPADGLVLLPWEEQGFRARFEQDGAELAITATSCASLDPAAEFDVLGVGPARLRVEGIAGFAMEEPRAIELVRGETTEATVVLARVAR